MHARRRNTHGARCGAHSHDRHATMLYAAAQRRYAQNTAYSHRPPPQGKGVTKMKLAKLALSPFSSFHIIGLLVNCMMALGHLLVRRLTTCEEIRVLVQQRGSDRNRVTIRFCCTDVPKVRLPLKRQLRLSSRDRSSVKTLPRVCIGQSLLKILLNAHGVVGTHQPRPLLSRTDTRNGAASDLRTARLYTTHRPCRAIESNIREQGSVATLTSH